METPVEEEGAAGGVSESSGGRREVVREEKRHKCPPYSGESDDRYDIWKKRVEIWYKMVGKDTDCPGGEIMMVLGKKAFECVSHVEVFGVGKEEGYKRVLESLDEVYGKERDREKYEKVNEFFHIKKGESESIVKFVRRFENLGKECFSYGGISMSEGMQCIHMLNGACLNTIQREIVLGLCGKGEWKLDSFKNSLINVCAEGERSEKKNEINSWVEGTSSANAGTSMNKRNKYGEVMKCILCRSVYHFAARCPSRGKGKGRGRGMNQVQVQQGESDRRYVGSGVGGKGKKNESDETREKAKESFMSLKAQEGNLYGDILAILDTGCERNVIGEK